jgi:hypothetical protein
MLCCFSDCLRVCRGEAGDAPSTHERLEKREDEDDGREKLRTNGAGEGVKSRRCWVVSAFSDGGFCGHAVCEFVG